MEDSEIDKARKFFYLKISHHVYRLRTLEGSRLLT